MLCLDLTDETTSFALMKAEDRIADLTSERIAALTSEFRIKTRTKLKQHENPFSWGWFIVPVRSYVEFPDYGPVLAREVEWVELDPIKQQSIGRLVPMQIIDHTPSLLQQLAAHGISYQLVEGRIRIML